MPEACSRSHLFSDPATDINVGAFLTNNDSGNEYDNDNRFADNDNVSWLHQLCLEHHI